MRLLWSQRAAPPLARQSPQCVFRRVSPESWLKYHNNSMADAFPTTLPYTAVHYERPPHPSSGLYRGKTPPLANERVYKSGALLLVKDGVYSPLGQQITTRTMTCVYIQDELALKKKKIHRFLKSVGKQTERMMNFGHAHFRSTVQTNGVCKIWSDESLKFQCSPYFFLLQWHLS